MNFTQIYNGMVGRDFIKAFNDNFIIADHNLVDILATLIYKIKSTDIKEFKVINDVVSYTLEEAPTEGEDTREWIPVDITQWGNINGNIEDQTDLWNILEDKAAVETVETLSNLLSSLNANFEIVRSQVETNVTNISTNTNDIADILSALTEKVNSTNIKAIRLNNSVFQWSPDGRTWYEQPTITSIPWGHVIGDITTQDDLMYYFSEIQGQFTALDTTITGIQNSITTLTTNLGTLQSAFDAHLTEYGTYKTSVQDEMSLIEDKADGAVTTANTASSTLANHLVDYNNPHHVTKQTINLGNVDNTSDMNKPLSTAQKIYVDNEVVKAKQDIADKSGLVVATGNVSNLFVGDSSDYANVTSKVGLLAFIVDTNKISTECILSSQDYQTFDLYDDGVIMTPDSVTANNKVYKNIAKDGSAFVVKVDVSGTLNSYNIEMSYASITNIDVDKLVDENSEGGNA